jgi:hypothetical protein
MTEQCICCCCIRADNQLWAQNVSIDTAFWCCDIDTKKVTNFDTVRICPIAACTWCMLTTWVCPCDCYWFTTNGCSLLCTSFKSIDEEVKYTRNLCSENSIREYVDGLDRGLSRRNAFRGLFSLPPIMDDQSRLMLKKSPFDQYMA